MYTILQTYIEDLNKRRKVLYHMQTCKGKLLKIIEDKL